MMILLRQLAPPALVRAASRLVQRAQFEGGYASFAEAQARCGPGYGIGSVVEGYATRYAEIVRDPLAPLRDPIMGERVAHLLAALALVRRGDGASPLRVLDYGGGSGFYLELVRAVVPDLRLQWDVVETETVVAAAGRLGASASKRFHADLQAVADQPFDLCFASGALQYVPEPRATAERLLALRCGVHLFTRFPLGPWLERDVVAIQNVPKALGGMRYPAWFFSEGWLALLARGGREVVLQADVHGDVVTFEGRTFPYRMLLVRARP